MSRWLVVFRSHPSPPFDMTVVDVRGAATELEAVRDARSEQQISHPWHLAYAIPWPRDCADVDAAARQLAGVG